MDIFSIIPIEAAIDSRLTKNHYRVLIALLSFRSKSTNVVWPSRELLAERCGLPITRISEITSSLCALGWLEKTGKGGFSKSTRYTVTVPNIIKTTVTEPVTVTKSVTVTGSVTSTVTEPVIITVTESVTGIEETIEQTKEETNNTRTRKPSLNPDDVDEQLWKDFLVVRKAKRAPITETAIKLLRKEAEKAGITFSYAIQECVTRGWQGFKASWFADKKGKSLAEQEESDRRFREWIGDDGAIEGEVVK